MPLSFCLQKHSKALMFLNCASLERQMTRQHFLKWTAPAKSWVGARLGAPQNQALTRLSRKLSDIGLQPVWLTLLTAKLERAVPIRVLADVAVVSQVFQDCAPHFQRIHRALCFKKY